MYLTAVIDFLNKRDDVKIAESLLDTFAKYATSTEHYDELGMLYDKIKCYNKSIRMLERCLASAKNPVEMYTTRANMAKVYNHLNNPQKAITYTNLNLQVMPEDPDALMEQSFAYYLLGDYQTSYKIQSALLNRVDVPDGLKKRISYNMGSFDLSDGKFKTGLYKMILGGREIGVWPTIPRPFDNWDGKHTDKTILVFAESGFGDELINSRFMQHINNKKLNAIWVSSRFDIVSLLNRNNIPVTHIKDVDMSKEYVYCESTSLPLLLDVEQDELWLGPFIKPSEQHVKKWINKLPSKFIAIKTSGNPYYDQDLHRSIDQKTLIDSLSTLGLPLVSLHVDEVIDDPRVQTVDINSWEDTLAIQSLAVSTVSSCTSTVHSAGAAGLPCIVLPPIAKYYPWLPLRDNNTSYWYGNNLVVFPQTKHKDWTQPVEHATAYLAGKL